MNELKLEKENDKIYVGKTTFPYFKGAIGRKPCGCEIGWEGMFPVEFQRCGNTYGHYVRWVSFILKRKCNLPTCKGWKVTLKPGCKYLHLVKPELHQIS